MVSKRVGSKDIIEINTADVVEQVPINLPVYAYMELFIEKDMKITWQVIKDIFGGTFKEDLEDLHVYVKIHKSGLSKVACRYPAFPCADTIHWVVSHTNPKMMTLSNANAT